MALRKSCEMMRFCFMLKFVRGDMSYKIHVDRRRDSNTRQYDLI